MAEIHDGSVPFTSTTLLEPKTNNQLEDTPPEKVLWDQFPASYRVDDDLHAPHSTPPLDLLTQELEPKRLHRRMRFLWLAGRPVPPRPLHHQLLLGREIFVSERIDLHLVWGGGRIFIKPLPRYLMNPDFWRGHLTCRCHHHPSSHGPEKTTAVKQTQATLEHELSETGALCSPQESSSSGNGDMGPLCDKRRLRQCAMGFLLSYVALIAHESDFRIAAEKGLIPSQVTWPCWRKFVREVLHKSQENMWSEVAERFIYGELRLNRLNLIEVVLRGPFSRGYLATWTSFGSFYRYSSALIIAGTAYILLILSAMQVGLGTTKLAEDDTFQAASYGFAVFSILGPMGAVLAFMIVFAMTLIYNMLRTRRFEARRARRLGRQWGSKHQAQEDGHATVKASRV
ncbi:hypothetical protein F5144DRAFT_500355 [Chaetomium tenue]|uniref:Uncharacterized protein n=1 Tax=Chaetomium tenue TaxID=1854479 RepID=A0ACB7PKK6_9PEZI|nr:hypothetical protein F5144DRAFT_500355 [Chaetomium globosum]